MSNDLRAQIHHKLIESGEKERLKDHLRMRLIECGWRDQLKVHAKDIVRERGLERVKLEDLVKEITSLDDQAKAADNIAQQCEADIRDISKKITWLESEYDIANDQFVTSTNKLEETEKTFHTVWTSNVVPADIVRWPTGDPPWGAPDILAKSLANPDF